MTTAITAETASKSFQWSLNVAKTAKDNIGTGAMEFVSCADELPEGKKGHTLSKTQSLLDGRRTVGCLFQP